MKKDYQKFLEVWGEPNIELYTAYKDLDPFEKKVPKSLYSIITPSKLISEGFEQVEDGAFAKKFNNILELKYIFPVERALPKTYTWQLKEEKFKKLIYDLKKINDFLNNQVYRLSNEFQGLTEEHLLLGSEIRIFDENKAYCTAAFKTADELRKRKEVFVKKYSKFLNIIFQKPPVNTTCCTPQIFSFDAISTYSQLKLFFDFIKLAKDTFDNLRTHDRELRKLTPRMIRISIFQYYLYRKVISKARSLLKDGYALEEILEMEVIKNLLQYEYSLSKAFLEDATAHKKTNEDRKTIMSKPGRYFRGKREYNWSIKASKLATSLVSGMYYTTDGYIKQILKQEKEFVATVKKILPRLNTFDDFRMALGLHTVSPFDALEADVRIPIDIRKEYIKCTITHLSILPSKTLPRVK